MKIADSGRFTLFVSKEGCIIGAAPLDKSSRRTSKRKKRFESSPLAKQVASSEQAEQQSRPTDHKLSNFHTFEYPAEVPNLDYNSASPYSAKYASMKDDPNNPLRLDLENKRTSSSRFDRIPVNTTFGFYVAAVLLEPITLTEWERIIRSSDTWEEAAVFASKKFKGFPIVALGLDFHELRGFDKSPLSTDDN